MSSSPSQIRSTRRSAFAPSIPAHLCRPRPRVRPPLSPGSAALAEFRAQKLGDQVKALDSWLAANLPVNAEPNGGIYEGAGASALGGKKSIFEPDLVECTVCVSKREVSIHIILCPFASH